MRFSIVLLATVFLIGWHGKADGQATDRVALITDVSGSVEVASESSADFSSISWGQPLFDGDRIRTAGDGSASILFSNSNVLKLGPNSSLTVSPDVVQSESLSGPVRELDGELIASADLTLHRAGEGEIAALGGLRSGSAAENIHSVYPVNTRTLDARPTFRWMADDNFDAYQVFVRSNDGEIWSGRTTGTEITYPEDAPALEPGTTYYWHVEAETMLDSVDGPISTLITVDPETRDEIMQSRERIDSTFESNRDSGEYHYIMGSYLASQGLLGDAISSFEWIAERHPDSPTVHRILGTLYSDTGQKDEAIRSLKRAVELSNIK